MNLMTGLINQMAKSRGELADHRIDVSASEYETQIHVQLDDGRSMKRISCRRTMNNSTTYKLILEDRPI